MNDFQLDFDNILIVPSKNESEINSRKDINLIVNYTFKNGIKWSGVPIIASNMTTIGTFEMYNVLSMYKIITCFHKFYTKKDFENSNINFDKNYYMISSGITDKDYNNLTELIDFLNPLFVCIDIANGYMLKGKHFAKNLKKKYPNIIICYGNVISDIENLHNNYNIDFVKVGIGSGSACSTRLKTGIGYPQFSLILNNNKNEIISDGGCIYPGDIVKALSAGSKFVMIGGMLAGHDECLGNILYENNIPYKIFYGMSSNLAMETFGEIKNYKTTEGHVIKVKYKGKVKITIEDILGGLRSACSYLGINNLQDIKNNCNFIKVFNQNNKSLLN